MSSKKQPIGYKDGSHDLELIKTDVQCWRVVRKVLGRRINFDSASHKPLSKHVFQGGECVLNIGGVAAENPGGATAWFTFSSPSNLDASQVAHIQRRYRRQVSLATVALHAGWKFGALTGLRGISA